VMTWVRDVLRGEVSVPLARGERHALDGLLRLFGQADASERDRIAAEFAGLLEDPDARLAGLLMWLGFLKIRPEDVIAPAIGQIPDATPLGPRRQDLGGATHAVTMYPMN